MPPPGPWARRGRRCSSRPGERHSLRYDRCAGSKVRSPLLQPVPPDVSKWHASQWPGCFSTSFGTSARHRSRAVCATGVEPAPARDVDGAGNIPFQPYAFRLARPAPGRHRRQQRPRIRMPGIAKQRLAIRLLHHHPQVHDGHLVADMLHHGQIVGDEQERQVQLPLQVAQEVRIWAWIATSSADTGSSQTMKSGCNANARAMLMRCRCPPENWWGNRFLWLGRSPHQRKQLRDTLLAFRGGCRPSVRRAGS